MFSFWLGRRKVVLRLLNLHYGVGNFIEFTSFLSSIIRWKNQPKCWFSFVPRRHVIWLKICLSSSCPRYDICYQVWRHFEPLVRDHRISCLDWYVQYIICSTYDKVSDHPIIWVREMDESESGQMVLEKVKWIYFDAYLWQTMLNHAKNQRKGSNFQIQCFHNETSGALC